MAAPAGISAWGHTITPSSRDHQSTLILRQMQSYPAQGHSLLPQHHLHKDNHRWAAVKCVCASIENRLKLHMVLCVNALADFSGQPMLPFLLEMLHLLLHTSPFCHNAKTALQPVYWAF